MTRARAGDSRIAAILGPTNTGKTHLALERMMAHGTGVFGLPLRLLARELYDKVVKAKGPASVALITGEEKIVPPTARYFLCTVEAMPLNMRPAFLAVDEIQLAADPERGHIFTDRLLHARGTQETLFLGAATMRPILRHLIPDAEIEERERFSTLSYAGTKKLTKLPRRSAIVAFSSEDVYSIAELVRRQRGGAAVVMGALSPRTRNAQVELYQSGEVDFLIATDAIGMGLNMDVDHVAFASYTKFDGRKRRRLFPQEVGQIAGRAGRFRSDGTFGETADARPLDPDVIERVEDHEFEPIKKLTWRESHLDLSSLDNLRYSLNAPSPDPVLERVRSASDEDVLDLVSRDPDVRERAAARGGTARLWDVCRTPDFRKTSPDDHARLISTLYMHLTSSKGYLPDAWLDAQLSRLSKTAGDVDALAQRLAYVRTWSYAAHRKDWTKDPEYWTSRTREVEDQLSDALHERLTARFIDRRTSALMKGLREKTDLEAGLNRLGEVTVEGHFVGRLNGLSFEADAAGEPLARRAVANAAMKAVRPEVNRLLSQLSQAEDAELTLGEDGVLSWKDDPVGRLQAGGDPFTPSVALIGGELGSSELIAQAEKRLMDFAASQAETRLEPLLNLRKALKEDGKLDGLARGVAYQLVESFGAMSRIKLADELAALSVPERQSLRRAGVRIGEHAVFMPALLKPGAARLLSMLKAIHEGDIERAVNPPPGLTSIPNDRRYTLADYAAAGFQPCGPRAVRLDMLERLADLIREQRSENKERRFEPNAPMTALLGCSNDDLREVLKALGYRRVQKAAEDQPELWAGRSRSTQRPAQPGQKPPHAKGKGKGLRKDAQKSRPQPAKDKPVDPDSPFAALAALELEQPKPASQKRRKPRKKPKDKSAETPAETAQDEHKPADAPTADPSASSPDAGAAPIEAPAASDTASADKDHS
ncbi:helicase-related protein [Oceanicaulis sp. MMSF_3324]|uniref:helicase-related protein n=1 Tax=Oceanicaulis sp. MMSF_3324 TaxID=3046702 RepID=UPI00273D101C|nr:helicase-related protein [Oceanicaulis sp. MMSF_3324]